MKSIDNSSLPIGIFDSGVGGLTALYELSQKLPNEAFIYYADSIHSPYGTKKPSEILTYCKEIVDILLEKGVKCIIIACNTASGIVLESLQKEYPNIHFIGMIHAGVQAIKNTDSKNITLLATESTIKQGFYNKAFREEEGYIFQGIECPLLVKLAESGDILASEAEKAVLTYLAKIKFPTELLVLGCTHFPLFQALFEKHIEKSISIINPAKIVALETELYLSKNALLNKGTKKEDIFIITGNKDIFSSIYFHLFKRKLLL